MTKARVRLLVTALVLCVWLVFAAVAAASEDFTLRARFTPDKLGVPTNLSASAMFMSTTAGALPPVTKVTAYAPAGMSVDARGARTCTVTALQLQEAGPEACPTESRIGFGGGTAKSELGGEILSAPFTLEFFLAPSQGGRHAFLVYVNSSSPSSFDMGLVAREIRAPKPYGIGLTFAIPVVESLPGASLGWVERAQLTFGSSNIAYFRTVHGRRKLLHVKGVVAPSSCPRGGFPMEVLVEYADATASNAKTTIPCPR
jgi:hypothetical protein